MTRNGKKILTVFVSVLITLIVAEFVVRAFTIYPNTIASNRILDENIGFRASQNIPGIDSEGFRNQEGIPKTIVAIGDSQTFGFNVPPVGSWPSVLGKMLRQPIYNFGSGGYGLIAYHGMLKLFLDPKTQVAIVALYPANDFEQYFATDADCLILENPSPFWKAERERLKLEWPSYPVGCLHNDDSSETGYFDAIANHIAVLSMARDGLSALFGIDRSVGTGLPGGGVDKGFFAFPDGLGAISVSRVEMHERSTDPKVPEVAAMMKDFSIFLNDWKTQSNGRVKIGVMVLPSRERVLYDYFDKKGRLGDLDPRFVSGMQKQIAMEQFVRNKLTESGLPFVFANEDLYHHLEFGLKKGIPLYPKADNGHPLELGYAGYAAAAQRLMVKMGMVPNTQN